MSDQDSVVRKRSPRSPGFPLKDALARALTIYEKEGRHPIPAEVAAQDLGYKDSSSGAARATLATLRQFGVVIHPKEGYLAVARPVEAYKYAPDEGTKAAIIAEFARTPTVYRMLLNKFSERLPSDAALRFELIGMGFLPSTVENELNNFKATVEFAQLYSHPQPEVTAKDDGVPQSTNAGNPTPASANTSKTESSEVLERRGDRIPIRLSGGRRAILEIPVPFYEADKKIIKAQVDLVLADDGATDLASEKERSS